MRFTLLLAFMLIALPAFAASGVLGILDSDTKFSLAPGDNHRDSKLLAANVAESFTVPQLNGQYAKFVKFKGTGDFYAQALTATEAEDKAVGGTLTEHVTNGAFGSDTGWTKGTGWTIAGGVADSDGAQAAASVLTQASVVTLVPGYAYTITYTTTRSAGTVTPVLGGTSGTVRSSAATFSEVIVAGAASTIAFSADADFVGTIDNVSVTPWALGAGWVTGSGVATATTSDAALSQVAKLSSPLIEGQTYLVTYTATRSAGTVTVSLGGTDGTARSSSATFAEVITAGATQTLAFTGEGFTGTVDVVSVVAAASVPGDLANGRAPPLNPSGLALNGNFYKLSIVSAGTPIVVAEFFN